MVAHVSSCASLTSAIARGPVRSWAGAYLCQASLYKMEPQISSLITMRVHDGAEQVACLVHTFQHHPHLPAATPPQAQGCVYTHACKP